jgi:hypothetical protein
MGGCFKPGLNHTYEEIFCQAQNGRAVCPENLKLFIDLTFFVFLRMLDQRSPPCSDMSWSGGG